MGGLRGQERTGDTGGSGSVRGGPWLSPRSFYSTEKRDARRARARTRARRRTPPFPHHSRADRSHRKPPRSTFALLSPCAAATRAKVRRQAEGTEREAWLARARKIDAVWARRRRPRTPFWAVAAGTCRPENVRIDRFSELGQVVVRSSKTSGHAGRNWAVSGGQNAGK